MGRFVITEAQPNEKYRFLPWLICGIGALFYCYEYFLRIAPSVMSIDLMATFHLNAGQYGDLTAFFYYVYTPMQLVVGILMDRYGPRRLLTVACLACSLGAILFASSHYVFVAAMGRSLIGFGAAFAFVGALKLATIWLPPERFASISGIITALGMIGAMIGDVLLTALVDYYGWRDTTWLMGWAGLILIILIFFIVRDRLKTSQKTPTFISELSFRDVFIGLLQSLTNKNIWFNGLIACFMYLPVSVFAELWGIPYLSQAHHLSRGDAAGVISMIFLGWAIGGPFFGWFSDLILLRKLPIIFGAVMALVTICIILYIPHLSLGWLYGLFLFFGLMTSTQVIVFAIGREVSQKHIAATAISLTNMFAMIGGAIFQPLIGVLLDFLWSGQTYHGAHVYSANSYQLALSILPVGLLITVVVSIFLKETRCKLLVQ